MFRGPYSPLRPLYDELLRLGLSLGEDVKACPCKTMVPLYRNHVFAQIKPATRTRVDFGFALGARKREGRLIETGGYAKKDRITHRIGIESLDQIDAEVQAMAEGGVRRGRGLSGRAWDISSRARARRFQRTL